VEQDRVAKRERESGKGSASRNAFTADDGQLYAADNGIPPRILFAPNPCSRLLYGQLGARCALVDDPRLARERLLQTTCM
jgi:hypothetical protein